MGTLLAFAIGYYLGGKAGESGLNETIKAVEVIRNSQEVKDMVEGGFSIGKDLFRRTFETLLERVSTREEKADLRRIA